jgi:hypothetical protein
VIALAGAELAELRGISTAPKAVLGYRAFVWHTPPIIPPERTGQATSLLSTAGLLRSDITAGEILEGVLELLADGGERAEGVLAGVGFKVVLDKHPRWPRMLLEYTETDLPGDADLNEARLVLRPRLTPVGLSRKLDPAWNFLSPADEELAARPAMCSVPECDGIIDNATIDKESLWDRYFTEAPRPLTSSELQYSDRKLRSRR